MVSRRWFIAAAAATAGVGRAQLLQAATSDTLDTAIVGGGVSGLYSAFRLVEAGMPANQLAVFEATDRIGGRTFSVRMPGAEGIVSEFGGMRYLTSHRIATALIEHLAIPNRGFPMGGPDNLVYIRGKRWKVGDYARKGAIPFDLAPDEQGLDPVALMVKAIDQIAPNADRLTMAQWAPIQRAAMVDGYPLHAWGYRELLNRSLSQEAMAVVRMGGGYLSIPTNWSASEALPWLLADFANHPQYRTLNDGLQSLALTLASRLGGKGVATEMGHRLVSLRVPTQTGTGLHELAFMTPSGLRVIRARRVILGLPRRSLELIEDFAALRDASVRTLMGSVTPRALCKAFMIHPEPYWRQFGLTSGSATTDLPARQFYYFGSEPERGANPSGFATMAYFDGDSEDFWDGLRQLESPGARGFTRMDPKGPFVQEMLRQLVTVHGLSAPPPVVSAGYMNWGDDPYGGGWHSWNQGEKSWEVMDRIETPLPGVSLHIVGEAWSTGQGWVEGALQTAENVLSARFNLPRPGWLPQ